MVASFALTSSLAVTYYQGALTLQVNVWVLLTRQAFGAEEEGLRTMFKEKRMWTTCSGSRSSKLGLEEYFNVCIQPVHHFDLSKGGAVATVHHSKLKEMKPWFKLLPAWGNPSIVQK